MWLVLLFGLLRLLPLDAHRLDAVGEESRAAVIVGPDTRFEAVQARPDLARRAAASFEPMSARSSAAEHNALPPQTRLAARGPEPASHRIASPRIGHSPAQFLRLAPARLDLGPHKCAQRLPRLDGPPLVAEVVDVDAREADVRDRGVGLRAQRKRRSRRVGRRVRRGEGGEQGRLGVQRGRAARQRAQEAEVRVEERVQQRVERLPPACMQPTNVTTRWR